MSESQFRTRLFAGFHNLIGLGQSPAKRLFYHQMEPSFGGCHSHFAMLIHPTGANRHHIQFNLGEHLLVIQKRLFYGQPLSSLGKSCGVIIGHRDDLGARNFKKRLIERMTIIATSGASNHTNAKNFVTIRTSSQCVPGGRRKKASASHRCGTLKKMSSLHLTLFLSISSELLSSKNRYPPTVGG